MTSSFDERDTILRLAKRVGEVLGRALSQLLGKQVDQAQQTLEGGCSGLLGIDFASLSFMDSRSAAEVLGHPSRIVAFAQLLEGLADVAKAKGETARERSHAQHALEVALEAVRRQRSHDEALALVQRLLPRVDRALLPAPYAATLDELSLS